MGRMPLKELAGFAPKIHLQTMKVAMAAMVERDLVWESDERIGRERTARWDTIAVLFLTKRVVKTGFHLRITRRMSPQQLLAQSF